MNKTWGSLCRRALARCFCVFQLAAIFCRRAVFRLGFSFGPMEHDSTVAGTSRADHKMGTNLWQRPHTITSRSPATAPILNKDMMYPLVMNKQFVDEAVGIEIGITKKPETHGMLEINPQSHHVSSSFGVGCSLLTFPTTCDPAALPASPSNFPYAPEKRSSMLT